jgi:hypothetical protein
VKTKFPKWRVAFMNDKDGNMNEIVAIDGIYENSNFVYKTIEESIIFQKDNPNKIISYFEPLSEEEKNIIDYLKQNGVKFS